MTIEQRTIYYNIGCRICLEFDIAISGRTLWRLVEIIEDEFEKSNDKVFDASYADGLKERVHNLNEEQFAAFWRWITLAYMEKCRDR